MPGSVFSGVLLILLLSLFSGPPASAEEAALPFSFQPGEKLTFQVSWEFIDAGEAVLEILPVESLNGVRCLHFVMNTRTTPFIDFFYKVRDRIESYTDLEMKRSLLYKKTKSGRKKKNVTVTMDWERLESQYHAEGEEWDPIPIMPGAFDPLSVFYAFRLKKLEPGIEINVPVTDGKKCVMGVAKVIRREIIESFGVKYDTYLVEPDVKDLGGVFEKSQDAGIKIWVTADQKKIPIRFESKVAVGRFISQLVSPKLHLSMR